MKAITLAFFAAAALSFTAEAKTSAGWCTEGNEYFMQDRHAGDGDTGRMQTYVCKNGRLVVKSVSSVTRCAEGKRSYQAVNVPGANRNNEVYAAATCIRGKWIFDNDAYNYTPTKGTARCKEGTIEYAQKIGPNGNPFAKDLICKNGKMVPMN